MLVSTPALESPSADSDSDDAMRPLPVSLDALRRHHFLRAVRLDAAGGRLQVDLSLAPA